MKNSKISWCDHTANAWYGCSRVHVGCSNCYAEAMSRRFPKTFGVWGPHGVRRARPETFAEVRRWDKSAAKRGVVERVFWNDLTASVG